MIDKRITAYAKGVLGEACACEYLQKRGMAPLCERYHSPFGEIDLIMLDGETLVMVEVKARERAGKQGALEAVTPAKQKRIVQTASHFLGEHPEYADRCVRFDVVAITADGVLHVPNAFDASGF